MDNQHKKIKGYRDLSHDEIDLMNHIKEHGEATKQLIIDVSKMRDHDYQYRNIDGSSLNESQVLCRCLNIASEKLQTGFMWFVRAVVLPDSF